jgi:hypothetical protein
MSAWANPHFVDLSSDYDRPLSKIRKQIRLLVVEPREGSDIVCSFPQTATFDHEYLPRYKTISYCWGDSKIRDWMLVDGYLVNVPASAAAAVP